LCRKVDERDATTRHNAFLECGFDGSDSVIDAEFLFVDLGFGGTADLDNGDFAVERGAAFDEVFAVVLALGGFFLGFDLINSRSQLSH
jgi:hypothetical protein